MHLVGIGGAGMSALARLLTGLGAEVTGSDCSRNAVVEELRAQGIRLWIGHRPDEVHGENGCVIRSAAVPESDPEVRECVRRGFTSLLYAEAIGRLSAGKRTLAVAGTHGKTTTTALTVAAARGAGFDPSHAVGGDVPELGGNGYGGRDDLFVVEACEFNRSFHHLSPAAAAILNVDHDHFDCYASPDDLLTAFAGYVRRVPSGGTVLLHEAIPEALAAAACADVRVLRVGSGPYADVRAADVAEDLGRCSFVPVLEGRRLPRVRLAQPGDFQVLNALFALGLVATVGGDLEGACRAVSAFAGVRRRFEMHEGAGGGLLVNDYAHHPAELRAVLQAARRRFPGRPLLVVFQPHQHQRTWRLLDEFVAALAEADQCLIADIYGARESPEMRATVTAADLVARLRARGTRCEPAGPLDAVVARVLERRDPRDLVLVLGAGDIDAVVHDLVAAI